MKPPPIRIHAIGLTQSATYLRSRQRGAVGPIRPDAAEQPGPPRRSARSDSGIRTPSRGTPRRRGSHRFPPWLGVAALVLPLLARSQWHSPYPQVPLVPLACDDVAAPLAIDIIDDRSSSTYANDPRHRREPELRQVVEWMDNADCHAADAVSVQNFDEVLPPVSRVALNDEAALEVVQQALPDRTSESSSTLTPSARRAVAWASDQPEAHNMLLVATDGELSDFEEAFAALESYPGSVHVLALGGDLPPEWEHAPNHNVVALRDRARFGDIARAITEEIRVASRNREREERSDG